MKPKWQYAPFAFGSALIILALLGIYIANRIYPYEMITKGILGGVVLYLLFFYIKHSGIDASMNTMLSDPRWHRYLLYALVGPGIAYVAMGYLYDLISFLIAGP